MVTLPWPFVADPVEKERGGDNSNLSFLTAKPHGLRDALTWMGYPSSFLRCRSPSVAILDTFTMSPPRIVPGPRRSY